MYHEGRRRHNTGGKSPLVASLDSAGLCDAARAGAEHVWGVGDCADDCTFTLVIDGFAFDVVATAENCSPLSINFILSPSL